MYLPTTKEELDNRGWDKLDIILVTGDTYIDSPYIGVVVIGKILENAGYRVGIIAQPDINCTKDITRLGEPKIFWGISGGCVDSMVANYTASKKFRNQDDYTPGGINNKRPDRASLVYTNLIRQNFKNTVPIVLGGIEASLRRVSHYDFWNNKIRKPILFDSKADYLVYGMAENSVLELTKAIKDSSGIENIRGICYISKEPRDEYLQLPSHDEVLKDKEKFIDMFDTFYQNNDPITAIGLCQKVDTRFLIQNPPMKYLTTKELDEISEINYSRDIHPYYKKDGAVRAQDTIKFSVTTHQGCYGECNFCAIGVHQGRTIRERSKESIVKEIENITKQKDFKGIIPDIGGPTANMYGFECTKKIDKGTCEDKRCLFPTRCPAMKVDHSKQIELLREVRKIPKVKKAFIASGIRYDLINDDKKQGFNYLKEITQHHISGQMKIAPEHTDDRVLNLMGKPGKDSLIEFKKHFDKLNKLHGKKQYLTYYLIAAHPGCEDLHMDNLKDFTTNELKINPEQAQIFTPTPSTYSALMYYTELDPKTRKKIYVEKELHKKEKQKNIVTNKQCSKSGFAT